jgi:hypothetical protein
MNFGTLRVLNDDTIASGQGFGMHPHDNMEIITIMLEGEIKHKDSMGNEGVIRENEIQVISAGSGIMHSEFKNSKSDLCKLFQIWIFPDERDINPSYNQSSFINDQKTNEIVNLVGPKNSDFKLTINQNAYISSAKLDKDLFIAYNLKDTNNGVYVFLISGSVEIAGDLLNSRDATGIWDSEKIELKSKEDSQVLFIEVPMSK